MEKKEEQKGTLKGFFKRYWNFLIVILLVIMAVVYYNMRISGVERKSTEQMALMETEYKSTIDSLRLVKMEQLCKTFSWAVRSELIRNNLEGVDILFNTFIKEPDILKLTLVNSADGTVWLSTDKKEQGELFPDDLVKGVTDLTRDGNRIIVPVNGLSEKIATLIVSF